LTKEGWNFEEGDSIAPGRTVLRSLGGGRRYEVFLVWDDKLFAIMVAKVLRPHRLGDEGALRGLRREAQLLARLAHPVLLRGFDSVVEGPHPHLLVEHLEGPTLAALIERHGALPLEQVLPLALHLGSALHYLAGEEVVHLDVKPDNVVMGLPPRLIDLSLARTLPEARELRRQVGTDAYMAPEQCAPDSGKQIGPAADIWGLGVTLYQAISGELPFPAPRRGANDGPAARFPQLTGEPRPFRVDPPQVLADQVLRCMSSDPAQRPTAEQLVLALQPVVAALPSKLTLGRRGGVRGL